MSLTALLSHIDRDTRRQTRARAGSVLARPLPASDARIVHWGGVIRHAFAVKPAGLSIPEGAVVIAVRRNEHGQCLGLLIEAFEGDRAAFASFPRLAHMLGATELHVGLTDGTMLERILCVDRLADNARFDRAALLSRPLVVAGQFDRSAIMRTACAVAKARQTMTGETWGACLSAALKGVWTLAKAARLAMAH